MAWITPMTFVSNTVLKSSDLNIYLRDNLLEMSPSKAQTAGSLIVSDSPNSVRERTPTSDFVSVTETCTSTTYVDLDTVGPQVSVRSGSSAFVYVYTNMLSNTTASWMSYGISGATTVSADDSWGMNLSFNGGQRLGLGIMHTGLTPGVNTFTAKYRLTGSGTSTYSNRRLVVLPL